ncbi:ComEC/Rec2 family competence protein [Tepidibacter hydrothermalis]|uniref:MBL fold metallo-hydrolase n=1 Tax=Tepidibacter hydrothermalis TaxID=3036126 RepID=A0ABY8EF49_9FIRM|nr:MBL fold metallo-hydrolase [Tepidibacter hydrothermalis]WFD11561.1 MBL fold metallo-hydrolase [Tepidibacter hydrothermalis]
MKRTLLIILIMLSIILCACTQTNEESINCSLSDNSLSVHFIDVAQGDSTLLISPDNKTMLIDAGDNSHGKKVVNYLNKLNIKKIDILIGTHPDADHIGGLDYVINHFDIGLFCMPNKAHNTNTFKDVLSAAKNKNLKIHKTKSGMNFSLGKFIKCNVLSPTKNYDNNNLCSLVIKSTYKNKSFLFTGDAEFQNEQDMIKSNYNLESDILKVGHHGSSSSTSENFLLKVKPDIAVISCKCNNKYHHPSEKTLALLRKYNIPLYRTDKQGDIVLFCDGYKIFSYKKPLTIYRR